MPHDNFCCVHFFSQTLPMIFIQSVRLLIAVPSFSTQNNKLYEKGTPHALLRCNFSRQTLGKKIKISLRNRIPGTEFYPKRSKNTIKTHEFAFEQKHPCSTTFITLNDRPAEVMAAISTAVWHSKEDKQAALYSAHARC